MQNTADTAWERTNRSGGIWDYVGPTIDVCRWSFAYLPDARMKAVAADWMARVLLGADPGEMSEEELQIVAVSHSMAAGDAGDRGLLLDA